MKHHQLTEAQACAFHELTKVEIIVWCYCKASDPFGANPIPGPTAIARATSLGKSSVSEALKSLKKKGWSVRADEHSVRADEHSVRAHEQNVRTDERNVRADEHSVRADEHSTAKTLSMTESQDSLDLKDLKIEDPERRERDAIAQGQEIGPDAPTPILQAIAQVEQNSLDPQHGLTRSQLSREARGKIQSIGEGKIPAAEYPKVRDFVLAKVKRLPDPPQFPFKVAMAMIHRDPEAMWQEYQASKPQPSIATEILSRATGTRDNPWPEPEPQAKPEPTATDHAARLAAKWRNLPSQRQSVAAECQRLGIPCTAQGPVIPVSA